MSPKPAPWRFPARNRIIAALADVVVVVESDVTGGSMHTVESALERDRTVMAVPGSVRSRVSARVGEGSGRAGAIRSQLERTHREVLDVFPAWTYHVRHNVDNGRDHSAVQAAWKARRGES